MALGVQVAAATQGGSKITLLEDKVKLAGGRTEETAQGTPSLNMPLLKIEDEGLRGVRPREDGNRVAGAGVALGSAGQSPSSPLSSRSSPSSSFPSPAVSPGRSFPNFMRDSKPSSDLGLGQNNLQQNYAVNKDGFYAQGSQVSGHLGERDATGPSFTGSTRTSPGHREKDVKTVTSSMSRDLLGSLNENSAALLTGNETLKPSLGNQSVTEPSGATPAAAELTDSKADANEGPRAGLPPGVGVSGKGETGMRQENSSHTEKERTGSSSSPSRGVTGRVTTHDLSQDLSRVEDRRVGLHATANRETKTSQSTELPQRTTVRRAMSDCSHLSVPTVMAGTYPTGMGGLLAMPNMQNICPPRAPYPHVAVRRSLTVTEGTEAAAAMATMMSSPLMTSPVLPSSPPPKRHHGSCETNFLLAVPPPAGTCVSTQDNKINITGKSFFLCAYIHVGIEIRKKMNTHILGKFTYLTNPIQCPIKESEGRIQN